MSILTLARQLKHAAFVAHKRNEKRVTDIWDDLLRVRAAHTHYTFDVDSHRDRYGELPRQYFLHRSAPQGPSSKEVPDLRVFCFWTGDNDLPPARVEGLDAMRQMIGVPVELITPEKLPAWVVEGHPLHPMYSQLSYVHRSDYLRAYFMAHHGGGYSDIKQPTHYWRTAWTHFQDPEAWAVGYPERSSRACGGDDHTRLGQDIHRNFPRLIGLGAFIMRRGTPFAQEWLREIDRRLDYYAGELEQHPGGIWGEEPGYPLRWVEIGSDVFHPLQLKHLSHIRQDGDVLPELASHR